MPGPGQDDPLEAALDELYGVDADEFVDSRKRLVGELRGAGEKDAAKLLGAARRPTTAAWALNQLRRREVHQVEEFFDLSRVLEIAQTRASSSGRDAMRDATKAQREALAAMTDAAMAILGSGATEATRSQIRSTLQAASADPAVAEHLQQGRLVKEVSGATGFPDVPGLTLVPDLHPSRAPAAKPAREKAARAKAPANGDAKRAATLKTAPSERAAAEARRKEAREREAAERKEQRRREAEAAAESAQVDADDAKRAATAAHERVGALEQELDEARRAARAADTEAGRTHKHAGRLARDAAKLRDA
jgi:hypothetical protein